MSQLEELLQQCTAKLTIPGRIGWGTGFFVAPGWILTCAHVVQEAKGAPVQVRWQKQENWAQALVERSLPKPYDLALLRVIFPTDANPPCVYLDESVHSRDPLYLFGYPDQDFPNGCPVTFNCEGLTGDEPALIKFALGQVRPGMSGSPLLNQRTGKVCGIVSFTRDRSFDLGGGAVPTAVILAQFPELVDRQQSFHQNDQRWIKRVKGVVAVNPITSSFTRATLSLSAYDATTWVGRSSLVTALTQKLESGYRILTLTGIAGIGKTALAERVAIEVSKNGTTFCRINFDDRGQGRDFLSGALALLLKLGETVTTQDQKDSQNALNHLLKTLRDNRFLVQIDSLEMLLQDDEQTGWNAFSDSLWVDFFQQLLAGVNCQSQLLLTTQALSEELEIVGSSYPRFWHCQDLTGLSEVEQLELFEKNGLKPHKLGTEILNRIGILYQGHPLVIQIIARDMLDKPFNGNVQQYWQRYQAEFEEIGRIKQKRSSPRALQLKVKKRVEQSLKRLPTNALKMLCHSSVYRRPVPETFWLATLEELSENEQWTALESLKSHNLVEEELRSDGILLLRQHNLVKNVGHQLLIKDKAAWRAAECKAAQVWLTSYEPEPEALNLEILLGSLEAFYHSCNVENWNAAKEILIDQGVGDQLLTWGYCQEMLLLYQQILGKLDVVIDGVCEKGIGNAYWFLDNYSQAIEHHQKCLVIARQTGDRQGEGKALGNLGGVYQRLSNYPLAIEYHQQSLTIARETSNQLGEAISLLSLGLSHHKICEYSQAIDFYEKSLLIACKRGDRGVESSVYGNLGIVYLNLGQLSKALEYCQQELLIARELGFRRGEGAAAGNLGSIYLRQKNFSQAEEYCKQSLTIAREIGNRSGESSALITLGANCIQLRKYSEAEDYFRRGLTVAIEIYDRGSESAALAGLGKNYLWQGEYRKAIDYLQESLVIVDKINDHDRRCTVLNDLALALGYLNDYSQAIELYQSSSEIAKKIGITEQEMIALKGKAMSLSGLALNYLDEGNYYQAFVCYQKKLLLAKEKSFFKVENYAIIELRSLHSKLLKLVDSSNCEESSEYMLIALEISKNIGIK